MRFSKDVADTLRDWVKEKVEEEPDVETAQGSELNADDIASETSQTLRDIQNIKSFLSSQAPYPLLDAPWTPLFILFVYLLHPVLGHIAKASGKYPSSFASFFR